MLYIMHDVIIWRIKVC